LNKFLFVLTAILCAGIPACSERSGPVPIILISIDTLRPDHLGCHGYGRETSPNLDRLAAEEAVLFESAYAQAPYTLPSHMSMFTSLYPEAHGSLKPVIYPEGKPGEKVITKLPEAVVTLAEILQSKGYLTSAFTDGGLVSAIYGFDQGFSEYRDERSKGDAPNGFRRFGSPMHAWLREHSRESFFLFIHTFDTHGPYNAPDTFVEKLKTMPPGRELPQIQLKLLSFLHYHDYLELDRYQSLQEVVDAYDACIRFVDHELGRLFDLLEELDLWDDALIIVTSDHGESFLENGLTIGHSIFLTQEEVRIPLIIKFPHGRFAGRRITQIVETVDFMPTIIKCLDLPVPEFCQGQDLLGALEHGRWPKDFAYGMSPITGANRYFFRKGIKYIEGSRDDAAGNTLLTVLKPADPIGHERPPSEIPPEGRAAYYDMDRDPLGLKELFYRGNRLYDLSDIESEWNADELTDRRVFNEYRKASERIAERSLEYWRRLHRDRNDGNALTEEKLQALAELGYGGLISASTAKEGEPAGMAPSFPSSKFVDRTLLHEGDFLQIELGTLLDGEGIPDAKDVQALYDAAHDAYGKFLESHPERNAWVGWRLNTLQLLANRAKEKGCPVLPSGHQ
jgi:arylsulfatase A-like enzyme